MLKLILNHNEAVAFYAGVHIAIVIKMFRYSNVFFYNPRFGS
jgi:hypothetical protein